MRTRRNLGLALGLAALVTGGAPALAAILELSPPPGMMTVGRWQALILGAVLTQAPHPDRPGCALTLSLVDTNGQVLVRSRTGEAVRKRVLLRGNVADELSVRTNEILGPGQSQRTVRWVVEETPDTGTVSCCQSIVVSEEIAIIRGGGLVPSVLKQMAPPPIAQSRNEDPDPTCLVGQEPL